MRPIKKIIIHCSDSDILSHDNIETIREWHKVRGFKDVGYHYFISKAGIVSKGRELEIAGAHCKGNNSDSIGICFSGRHHFTIQQFNTGKLLIEMLLELFSLEERDVFPHNHFDHGKTCPNFDLNNLF